MLCVLASLADVALPSAATDELADASASETTMAVLLSVLFSAAGSSHSRSHHERTASLMTRSRIVSEVILCA